MTTKILTIPKAHHSAADWDFNFGGWKITTSQYVSPPSSIWYDWAAAVDYFQLCRHAGTTQLPEGRLVTWVRTQNLLNYVKLFFRNTAPLGTSNATNGYYVRLRPGELDWHLFEDLGGANQRNWSTGHATFPINTWRRYRLSWWLSWGVLQVRLEHEVAGEWVQDGEDISVADPLFGEEEIQRCGIGGRTRGSNQDLWWDDTEIWEYP